MANDPVLITSTAKRSKPGKSAVWTRTGQAYPHDIGAGLTVVLATPIERHFGGDGMVGAASERKQAVPTS